MLNKRDKMTGNTELGKSETKKPKGFLTAIQVRIIGVVIAAALVINASGLAVGAVLLTRSINYAIEDDMLVAVDLADQYVSKEIAMLKLKAAGAARDIWMYITPYDRSRAGGAEGILARVRETYPEYIGFVIFNGPAVWGSCGEVRVPPDLYSEQFMYIAMNGGQAVSTTKQCLDDQLVMYVTAPIGNEFVLVAVLPGMYLSDLVSKFTFWQSGHLYITDADGALLAHSRPEWVLHRMNFVESARINNAYEDISAMITRGIAGERSTARFYLEGSPRISAFRPISSPNKDWIVGITAPLNESALNDIPATILLMAIITMALSMVAAIVAAILLRRPYEEANRLRFSAETASGSKSAFLAHMSHEIRTPMNSIMGFSELAMDSGISPKARDYLTKIQENAEWLLYIINDILDISKVESGKMELEKIPFDMHELFNSCRTLIMPKAFEKGILLHFYAEPSIGKKPLGDPTRLRQVIVNLLSNAVKFTNAGMVKLHASIIDKGEKSITMHFEVKDSGIGMSSEQLEIIFDPFAQAESGITRKYGGTGLGLAISKNIVELMGGTLSVESSLGIGSKFSFNLTFDTIGVLEEDLFTQKAVLTELKKPTFNGDILVCEDNPMNQEVITEHLSRVGLKTFVAGNGKVGLEMIQSRKEKGSKQFDLVFMDIHMPIMDGLEASAKILELKTGIPVIAMTANIMTNDMEVYSLSGINDCVGKPFTSQELWHCLMKYLKPISQEHMNKYEYTEAETEFQKSLHIMFLKNNQNLVEEITKALKEDDIKLAHRLVHTLKGNAGQLGKNILQQTAANIEHLLKEGKNLVTEEQLKVLETELKAVLSDIATEFAELLEGSSNPRKKSGLTQESLDSKSVQELIEKLETTLKMGSPECLKFTDAISLIPGNDGLKNLLIEQLEDFDFDASIATLNKLKEMLKGPESKA